jgi:hypothetical protein
MEDLKMMKNSNLEELLGALETIRAEKYPEVPKEVLEDLLMVEYENQDDRAEGQAKAMKILDEYLNKLVD